MGQICMFTMFNLPNNYRSLKKVSAWRILIRKLAKSNFICYMGLNNNIIYVDICIFGLWNIVVDLLCNYINN